MKTFICFAMMFIAANAAGQWPCPGGVCPAPGPNGPGSLSGARCVATAPANVCRVTHRLGAATCHGSGTLVASDTESSYILTCFHLFRDGAGETVVAFPGRAPQPAAIVASDARHDLAILRTARVGATPVTLARSDPRGTLRTGGYGSAGAYGEARGPVVGYATAKGAEYRSLRIAAIVEQGDSGGPVFDSRGELTGVVWGELNGEVYATYGIPIWRLVERVTSQSQRVEKPVVAPSLQPVAPPVTPPACNCGEQWQRASEQLSTIHQQLSGVESRLAALATTLQHETPSSIPLPTEPPGIRIPWLQIASIALGIGGPVGFGIAAAGGLVMWRNGKQRRGQGGPRPRRFQDTKDETNE